MKLFVLGILFLLAGCATTGDGDPRDPFEGWNRGVYKFNDKFDDYLARPVAQTYQDWVPREIRDRVRNFFGNLADPFIGVNNLLQGKVSEAFDDWTRFILNTTVGLVGIHDVATDFGLEKHNEDFGQTFGRWGAGTGPYLVLPIFGSSNLRDGIGLAADMVTDPMGEIRPIDARNTAIATRAVQTRADLLGASRVLGEAALDRYVFQRDAYLQRRRSLVYDGRPPREKFE
ncbi:MAG TPA: VacJ family lipoprotein [Burkholderiales bacterium]